MNTKTILSDLVVKQKFFTSMKYNFFLHSHINKLGKSQIFLYVNINGEKKRLPLNYYVSPSEWNPKTQRTKEHEINLVLDNIEAKITQIKTFFYISKKHLDLEKFLLEFSNASPSYDFIAFMKKCIIDRNFEEKTKRSELGIANKLQRYVNGPLPFSKIDIQFLDIYRGHLYKLGNKKSTVNNNIKKIKKYLGTAQKYGIILNFDLDQVKVGKTSGNRTFLVKQEIAKYINFYKSEFIADNLKLSLGYFLFACFTGLRIGDLLDQDRNEILSKRIHFLVSKSKKLQNVKIIDSAVKLVESDERLFKEFFTEQTMNGHIRTITQILGIKKKVSFHVGRHTFATNFILENGDVTRLKILLGHSKLEDTMIYVHLAEEEASNSIYLLDNAFAF